MHNDHINGVQPIIKVNTGITGCRRRNSNSSDGKDQIFEEYMAFGRILKRGKRKRAL
jgi:hypothetical protein